MGTRDAHDLIAWRAIEAALDLPASGRILVVGRTHSCTRDVFRGIMEGLAELDEVGHANLSRGRVVTESGATVMVEAATRVLMTIRGHQLDNVLVDDDAWSMLGSLEEMMGLEDALRHAVLARNGTVDDPTGTIFGPARDGENGRA